MKVHELKCWPEPFNAVAAKQKTYECRLDDGRGFEAGDYLLLKEWKPDAIKRMDAPNEGMFTGKACLVRVRSIDRPSNYYQGVNDDLVSMQIVLQQDTWD